MTPHLTSPMAIFGFVYAWYLMAVLLLELWFDYRRDFVVWSETTPGFQGLLYRLFTVGVMDDSDEAAQLEAAQERARIAEAEYSTGFITYDDWTIIEDNLVSAKINHLNAQANALLAEANWIQAKGETLEYAQK